MGQVEDYRALRKFFGYDQRTINSWEKKGLDFAELLDMYSASKSVRDFRNRFYAYFYSVSDNEFYIDRLWTRFINYRMKVEQELYEERQKIKKQKELLNEIKQGRKL